VVLEAETASTTDRKTSSSLAAGPNLKRLVGLRAETAEQETVLNPSWDFSRGASNANCPLTRITMRSLICSRSLVIWDENRTDLLCSDRTYSERAPRISWRTTGSRPEMGSSRRTKRGCLANASATASFILFPRERSRTRSPPLTWNRSRYC